MCKANGLKVNDIIKKAKFCTHKYNDVIILTNGNFQYIPTIINNLIKLIRQYKSSEKIIGIATSITSITSIIKNEYLI